MNAHDSAITALHGLLSPDVAKLDRDREAWDAARDAVAAAESETVRDCSAPPAVVLGDGGSEAGHARKTLCQRVEILRSLYRAGDCAAKPERLALASEAEFDALCDMFAEHGEMVDALEGLIADKYLADPINDDRMAGARAAIAKAKGGAL